MMPKLSLRTKVLFAMIPLIAGMVIITLIAVRDLGEVSGSLDRMLNVYGKRNQLGNEAIQQMNLAMAMQRQSLFSADPEARQKFLKNEDEAIASAQKNIDDYFATAGEYAKAHLPEAKDKLKDWIALDQDIRKLAGDGQKGQAVGLMMSKGEKLSEDFQKVVDGCYEASRGKMKAEADSGILTYTHSKVNLWVITLAASLLGLILIGFLVNNVNKMITAVGRIIKSLEGNSVELTEASQELSTSAQSLSDGASEQAASLEQTASALEQISSMVSKSAENAAKSQDLSNRSHTAATQGQQSVEEMIHVITEINQSNSDIQTQIEKSNHEVSEIVRVIGEIGEKTKVINEIVFQTKLLSFNASVEAARAGEHGKGFAVVAEEVGNLAQMSGNASKEISTMLNESIVKVKAIVDQSKTQVESLMASAKKKVDEGVVIAGRCGEVLSLVVENATAVNEGISEISTASTEQSQGIQEINKATAQLGQVTNGNANSARQSAEAAAKVSEQIKVLTETICDLSAVVNGTPAPAKAKPQESQSEEPEELLKSA